MKDTSTIQLKKKTIKELSEIKEHPRESYNDLISKMIKVYKLSINKNSYDEFLHKIQKMKMQELWDNADDEEWENA